MAFTQSRGSKEQGAEKSGDQKADQHQGHRPSGLSHAAFLSEGGDASTLRAVRAPRSRARTPAEQEQVRKQFLDCARRVHARDGAAGLTMRRLAAEVGYSTGTIYLYFPSRQSLLRELWSEDLMALLRAMQDAVATADDGPAARLAALFGAYADFWWQRPAPFRAMFLEADRQFMSERRAFAADPVVHQVNAFVMAQVRLAMEQPGECLPGVCLPQEDVDVTAHGLLAAVHGVISLHIGNSAFPWADRQRMVTFVLRSLIQAIVPI